MDIIKTRFVILTWDESGSATRKLYRGLRNNPPFYPFGMPDREEDSDANFILSVSDNGIGIPKDLDIEELDSLGFMSTDLLQ